MFISLSLQATPFLLDNAFCFRLANIRYGSIVAYFGSVSVFPAQEYFNHMTKPTKWLDQSLRCALSG